MGAKTTLARLLVGVGVDAAFRLLHRQKLLVLMYHGVTERSYHPPVWTHLPVTTFREQLRFVRDHYRVVTLDRLLTALEGGEPLPARAALVTFDDGYENNYRVALPVLQELKIPATVFLTVGMLGRPEPLWFDELYLHIAARENAAAPLPFPDGAGRDDFRNGRTWDAYWAAAEALKRCDDAARSRYLDALRAASRFADAAALEDFRLMNWNQVREMGSSGLVSFGVHTDSHVILSTLERSRWPEEIAAPRLKLEEALGGAQRAFCFPNGRPGVDFSPEHLAYLRSCGYLCAFSTASELFCPAQGDPMQIGRIAAGNDVTSDPFFFRLHTSGCFSALRSGMRRVSRQEGTS